MARNPELEALLQAKFDVDTADEERKAACERAYAARLDALVARSGVGGMTSKAVEEALLDVYREFKRAKRMEERAKLSRLR